MLVEWFSLEKSHRLTDYSGYTVTPRGRGFLPPSHRALDQRILPRLLYCALAQLPLVVR